MQRSNLAALPCSLARTLQVVGEWWTMLVLRDICFGLHRFDEIHDHLGIARNILKARLDTLVKHGLAERRRYQRRPDRYEYLATDKGRDLVPALLAHAACGHDTVATVVCSACAASLAAGEVSVRPGPGSADGADWRDRG